MQVYTRHQWRNAKVKSDGSVSKGRTPCPCTFLCYRCCALEQGIYEDAHGVRATRFSCTSGNETRTQNACASVHIRIVSYSYTVIVQYCTIFL